ncbi:MAG TPA: Asp-tRNA(Asn)/Glu-tRNA(Gln) amidotransferase subunit GatB [Acidobacteriota bacterium]|nr:Asp-tRNA(Asn)/Glu-tRNA(Gln) amidotransferase subunit GatB [Acidobacteriota bacterium]
MKYEPVIGLEVHAQLLTETKIFCACSTRFGAAPNENTCPVCLGLPGSLPVLNEKALELGLRAAIALEFNVPNVSIFARKNYFYPDLPKGYQISQYDRPLAVNGQLAIPSKERLKTVRIKRLHLEEDAGKLVHEGVENQSDGSYVDFNRSGVPLIEIVTEPDIHNPEDAYDYLMELKAILRYADVSLANMEEGNLRCDANISLRPKGTSELGTKIEIKNLNSFRNVQKALEYEIQRQTKALDSGEVLHQETRLFNVAKGITEPMRSKEEAHDYRYFPDPDLLPLRVTKEFYEHVRTTIPELPAQKRQRFSEEYQLSYGDAEVLTAERELANFYEKAVTESSSPKQTANWILRDLLQKLNETGINVDQSPVSPQHVAELVNLIQQGKISSNQGKEIFENMWTTGKKPSIIVDESGMTQLTGEEEVGGFVDEVIRNNPDVVQRLKLGEVKLQGVLVGQVMKATKGKANPELVNRLIREKIK